MFLSFQNKKVIILGGGLSGEAAIASLKNKNLSYLILADKTLTSSLVDLNIKDKEDYPLGTIDFIVKSPGISPEHPLIQKAKKNFVPIISEIDIANFYFKGTKIGVTGTNGKSTTASLIYHFISKIHPNCQLGGNIGNPFCNFAEKKEVDIAVLELSSYQLEDSKPLDLDISVFLNLHPDHLIRHKTLDNYVKIKFKIVNQNDANHILITNKTLKNLFLSQYKYKGKIWTFGEKNSDAFIKNGKFIQIQKDSFNIENFPLAGRHNIENLMATILVCQAVGMDSQIITENICSFQGLKHRFEVLGKKQNTIFINDSKATNIHSAISGLKNENLNEIILILGGKIKKEPIDPLLIRIKNQPLGLIYLFGEVVKKWKKPLKKLLNKNLLICNHLEEIFDSLSFYIKKKKTY